MHTIEKILVEQVRDFLDRVQINSHQYLVVGFSGGSDSLALLVLLTRILGQSGLCPVYVDHGLRSRAELDSEIAINQQNCQILGLKLRVESLPRGYVQEQARLRGNGIEEAARHCRYSILERIRLETESAWIATAHTVDDQIETVLMRMFQGSGPAGLGGIRPVDRVLIRPLLGIAKQDLEHLLMEKGMRWSFDTTNNDTHFLRNAVRSRLLPVVAELFPGYRQTCTNFMYKQREAAEFIASQASMVQNVVYSIDGDDVLINLGEFNRREPAVREQLLHIGWALLGKGGTALSFRSVRYILESLSDLDLHSCSKFRCIVQESELTSEGSKIRWRLGESPLASGWVSLVYSTETVLSHGFVLVRQPVPSEGPGRIAAIDESMLEFPVVARSAARGDFLELSGGTISVARLLSSWGVPLQKRSLVAVIEDRIGVCAVLGSAFGGKDRISKRLLLPILAPNSCTLYSVMDMFFARKVGCTCCSPVEGGEMDKD